MVFLFLLVWILLGLSLTLRGKKSDEQDRDQVGTSIMEIHKLKRKTQPKFSKLLQTNKLQVPTPKEKKIPNVEPSSQIQKAHNNFHEFISELV